MEPKKDSVDPRFELCFYCKKPGHMKSNCPEKKEKDATEKEKGDFGGRRKKSAMASGFPKKSKEEEEEDSSM